MKYFAFLLAAVLLPGPRIFAQEMAGNWLGTLPTGGNGLRIVFHIADEKGVLSVTMDSPDQGANGIPVSSAVRRGDSLLLAAGPIRFEGKLLRDSIAGVFIQGIRLPLTLRRTMRGRPQTPRAPFPYHSEEIVFKGPDGLQQYGATFTAPADGKRHPALLLLSGSGPQDRDGGIEDHKPFAVIADFLSRRGYAVLRVDDRGTGKTSAGPDPGSLTSADLATDAGVALEYLKHRAEVDSMKIGLLGHSEGGMIATMLAASRQDISFMIALAGPGVPNLQLLREQNDALRLQAGQSDALRKAYLQLYDSMLHAALRTPPEAVATVINEEVDEWKKGRPQSVVAAATGIRTPAEQQAFVDAFAAQLRLPWFRYFAAYDPAQFIPKIRCRVLVLNGSRDLQVVPGSNLAGWKAALARSSAASFSVKELPGLNHLFQECVRCDIGEYGELTQSISPAALAEIGDWLAREVR